MNRVDPAVNNMPLEELRTHLFQETWAPTRFKGEGLDKYRKLLATLKKFPVGNHKICFVSAPQIGPEAANYNTVKNRRYQLFPSHAFLMLSAAIHNFMPSWGVEIVDLHLELLKRTALGQSHDLDTLLKLIPLDCDLYGVTLMFESNEFETVRCMEHLRSKGKFVIAGGVHATPNFDILLKLNYCSIVIKKEAEAQLCKLLNLWERAHGKQSETDEHFQPIHNLAYKYEDEIICFEDIFENPVSLDIRKEYDLIDLDEYNIYGSTNIWARIVVPDRKWATILTNRGCRGNCIFCQVTKAMGHGVRSRSVDDVIDEILFLYHKKGVRHLEVIDDDLLGNHSRALEMFRRIAELKIDLTFATGGGVIGISINEEMAQAMVNAGFIMTGFGVETGNEKRLRSLRKPSSLKRIREACEIFKKNHRHIWLQANFILGFPNETLEEMMDTFNYAKSLEIDYCQIAVLTPIVGTYVYDEYRALKDERVLGQFGKEKVAMHSPGRGLVSRGLTFDDVYKEVYDFRKMDSKKVLIPLEVQQFLIFSNVFINLIGSVNLKPGGMPEKIKSFTDDVLRAYPMDAVSWGVNAKACRLLGDEHQYGIAVQNYRKAVRESRFWSQFFEIYDIPKLLGIPI